MQWLEFVEQEFNFKERHCPYCRPSQSDHIAKLFSQQPQSQYCHIRSDGRKVCHVLCDPYVKEVQVNTFGNDLILAEACRNDVIMFCKSEKPGRGRVHDCLRKHRQKLSTTCQKEELKLEIEESSNFELKTTFMQVGATFAAQLALSRRCCLTVLACTLSNSYPAIVP
jgi:hypothetical protein